VQFQHGEPIFSPQIANGQDRRPKKRINEILGRQFPPRMRIEIKNREKWLLDTRRNTYLVSRRQDESPDRIIEEEIPVEATRGEQFDPLRSFAGSAFPTADSQIE
jgi:hypothetical protein